MIAYGAAIVSQGAANQGGSAEEVAIFFFVMGASLLLVCIGYVVVASLLIHGARKEKPGLMMPWIILTVISLIFDVIQIIGNMVNADHAAWVGGLFFFAIGCYIFIVVWSHRKQLQENMGGGATGKPKTISRRRYLFSIGINF